MVMLGNVSNFSQAYSTSLSGINAGKVMQNVAAQNIANANTDNYQATKVELSSEASGGVNATTYTPDSPANGKSVNNPSQNLDQQDFKSNNNNNVSLVDEIMNLKTSGAQIQANVEAFKAHDKSVGTIINTVM